MRLKYRAIARAARKISDQLDRGAFSATWLMVHAEDIAYRANSDMDDALSATSYGSRSSDAPTPTEAHALQPPDPVTRVVLAMVNSMVEADRLTRRAELLMQNAERAGRWLLAMDAELARNETKDYAKRADTEDESAGSRCANPNCRKYVARTSNDRLRGGRCDACRKYLSRYSQERPRHLCALGDDLLGVDGLGLDAGRLIVS